MKICHIRGDKEYWHQVLKEPEYKLDVNKVIYYIQTLLDIDYFAYRKKIRDITIKSIEEKNHFDHICYNDEEFAQFYKNLKDDEDVLYFGIDDDDLYVGGDVLKTASDDGVYFTKNYSIRPEKINMRKLRHCEPPYNITLQDLKISKIPNSCSQFLISKLKFIKPLFDNIDKNATHAASAGRNRRAVFTQVGDVVSNSPLKGKYYTTKTPIQLTDKPPFNGISVFKCGIKTLI